MKKYISIKLLSICILDPRSVNKFLLVIWFFGLTVFAQNTQITWYIFSTDVSSSGVGFVEGSCSLPLANIVIANFIAADGDIIYLLPGNHSIGSGPLVISKRLTIGGSGNATVGQ